MVDSRLCQDISFPDSPSLDRALKGAWKMGDEFLVDFGLLVAIAAANLDLCGVGVEQQVFIERDRVAYLLLDFCDRERVMEVFW